MIPIRSRTLEFLSSDVRAEALASAKFRIYALQAELSASSDRLTAEAFADLNSKRFLVSQSLLGCEQERLAWDRANQFVAAELEAGRSLTLESLHQLNAVLTGGDGRPRTVPVYAGGFEYLPGDRFPEAIALLESRIFCEKETLVKASLAYIWLCNVHPYLNGNGRTARLFADSILMSEGFLPLCFETQVAGHVVESYAQREIKLEDAVLRCLNAIEHSYKIVLSELR